MQKSFFFHLRNQHGYSYLEVLLSVILLAVLLVPAMQSLSSAISGGSSNIATRQLALSSKMEEVLSKPYHQLYGITSLPGGNTSSSISSSLSDASGSNSRRLVVLYRYDPLTNVLSSTDTGVLYVKVYFEDAGVESELNTLAGRWW